MSTASTFPPECKNLILERKGSRLHVTLNRPEIKNALSGELVQDLSTIADHSANDPTLRAIILRGAGGTWCAGGDIK
ncbi:enoyl-CoA hydratase/isomerase family protein, partial [Candidatus Sumerlaeota bacterium]|nr:enoyl-CoA hydratase/isomerase family protein [Candidatus Sumerlaeota bacterium]